jgi:beta-lactamase regulating signal transducer with metallopeptidase domain
MLPAWMLYATALGCLACVAALAAERVFSVWGVPRRFVWVAAMTATIALPLALATRTPPRVARVAPTVALRRALMPARVVAAASTRPPLRLTIYRLSLRVERAARALWIVASLAVGAALIIALLSLNRHRGAWRGEKLYGHSVTVTPDLGPAVIGVFRPRIVIPEWALALPDRERRFMLQHELEHLLSNDPQLLLFTGIVLLLCPWNLALWWMAHRLRLAIEIDCDARVIELSDAPDEYGLFLVAVGERRASGLFLAATLAERRSSLERRIVAMTSLRPRRPLLVSLPLAAFVCGAAVLAAQTPTPPAAASGAGGVIRARVAAAPANRIKLSEDQVRSLIAAHHPDVLRGASEDNMATIVLASNGEYVVSGTTKAAFAGAVIARSPAAERDIAATRAAAEAAGAYAAVAPVVLRDTSAAVGNRERDIAAASDRGRVMAAAVAQTQGMLALPGVGSVDPSLIQDMYTTSYDAGIVSVNALRVRFVVLRGSSMK